jgi:hypothetical protein
MVPESEQVAVVQPFLAVGGLNEAPRALAREHVTSLKSVSYLPVPSGALLFLFERLTGVHNQSDPRSGEKIVLPPESY